jgi:antitoxin component of MazEF toxin-antitoxin module
MVYIEPRFKKKLRLIGNSHCVIVPAHWVKTLRAVEGDEIELEIKSIRKGSSSTRGRDAEYVTLSHISNFTDIFSVEEEKNADITA